ncbi:butyrophilin subfamily 3 member A2 isoform X6 [Chelonia mydas]|uniref:butyrophilin subfamily 3 member A2 isoform X6 n=1 Tax=Chelonia mydas TaxID=8469 RepID=UPI001CA8C54C|nr:butyrophilin subfamily 3 member A2 isoform X6 [Chelonia mydas]
MLSVCMYHFCLKSLQLCYIQYTVCFLSFLLSSGSSNSEMKVLSICHSSRARTLLPHFIIFFITFYVHKLESARFTVIGPDHPVTAIMGEDIILPCHLSPKMSAENMEVRWFRSEFTSFVHLYQHGKDEYGQQMPEYHGRTELLKAGIVDGNVALGIVNIRLSDEGQYRCFVQDGVFHEEAVLELKVAALPGGRCVCVREKGLKGTLQEGIPKCAFLGSQRGSALGWWQHLPIQASGSAPRISVEGHQDGGIQVVCQSAGWYPEPEALWRNLKGQPLSSSTETKSEEQHGLFEIKNSIVITENSNKNLSCAIRNTHLNREKESITFYISDSFFPRASPWMVGWSVTLVILLVFVGLTLFLFKLKGKHLNTITFSMIMNPIDTAFAWLNSHPHLCVCFQSGGDPWVMQQM